MDHLQFNELSSKFAQLSIRNEQDLIRINSLLDSLNYLDYRHPLVTNQTQAVLLVHQCCVLIPCEDSNLVAKSSQLITNLINRQQIIIEGKTLSLAIEWCLKILNQSISSVTIDVLVVLDALLKSNAHNSHLYIGKIVNSPITTLANSKSNPEVVLLAVQCLEACTSIPEVGKHKTDTSTSIPLLRDCAQVFLNYLSVEKFYFDDLLYCKLLISCIIGLRNVCEQDKTYLNEELSLLLGISKSYMTFGINGISFQVPRKLLPSPLNILETQNPLKEKKGGKVVKHRKPVKRKKDLGKPENEENSQFHGYIPATSIFNNLDQSENLHGNRLMTSDSDFSDSESGRTAKLGIIQGRLRQSVLNLLGNIIKSIEKHVVFSYWLNFISDGTTSNIHTLSTCILKDPSPKGRLAALNVLNSFLLASKHYLFQAELIRKETVFTSFSSILGATIAHLHKSLVLALNENSSIVLIHVLKCLANLIQGTPYHRLKEGLLKKVTRNVKQFIDHKEANVQVAALITLGSILSIDVPINESKQVFLRNKTTENVNKHRLLSNEVDYANFSSEDEEEIEIPWILQICLHKLGLGDEKIENIPAPVKLECLQVISAMTKNYFNCFLIPHLHQIEQVLEICFADKWTDLKLHSGRTLCFIGQSIAQSITNHDLSIEQGVNFWNTLIDSSLLYLIDSQQNSIVRAIGCDCISSIGLEIFEQLTRTKQVLLITQLFSCSRDEENNIKGAAVRALGLFIMYPSLRDDPGFVMDVTEVVTRMLNDENLNIRSQSSWSLANLSDALVLNKSDPTCEDIPESILLKLFEITIKSSSDRNRVRINSVRTLGNLLQLLSTNLIRQQTYKNLSEEAINVLVKYSNSANNLKVRWNACYALGNMLKNSDLSMSETLQSSVFDTLGHLVINFENFKVRINAAFALSCPINRKLYGIHFASTWINLLRALDNTENMKDFAEYKHRDNLVDQICLTLGHLTTLMQVEDLQQIQYETEFYFETFNTQVHKVLERLLPEKSTVLLTAITALNQINETNLSNSHKKFVIMLKNVFSIVAN